MLRVLVVYDETAVADSLVFVLSVNGAVAADSLATTQETLGRSKPNISLVEPVAQTELLAVNKSSRCPKLDNAGPWSSNHRNYPPQMSCCLPTLRAGG
jgi:hypothetical protein